MTPAAGARTSTRASTPFTERYPPLEDYGLVGDGHTAALVGRHGSVDWWCMPRFDSASVFGRILDWETGGFLEVAPVDAEEVAFDYEDGTNVLRHVVRTPRGRFTAFTFMPMPRRGESRLVHVLRCDAGRARVRVTFAPRFRYGADRPHVTVHDTGALARSGGAALALATDAPLKAEADAATGELDLREGDVRALVTASRPDGKPAARPDAHALAKSLDRTLEHWRAWAGRMAYDGAYRRHVERSALTLKLLTDASRGALVAAPTTSLPEAVGGERNWDYRYVWIRDAAFGVAALHALGYEDEACAFADWVTGVTNALEDERVGVMRRVDGTRVREEIVLEHLEGYRGSRPVRVGNDAATQHQLDVYGELVDFFHISRVLGTDYEEDAWSVVRALVDHVAEHWREPGSGIWEFRSGPRQFVYSKVMAWVALDRAVCAVENFALDGPVDHWTRVRDEIRADVLANGWNEDVGAFTISYDSRELDAATLLIPVVDFLPDTDPRVERTVRAVHERLEDRGLVHRYKNVDDGVPGPENAFVACTFWLVEALAETGREDAANELMSRVLERATPLGLFAEEIDPGSGAHRGNFPQGLSHIALVNAALTLEQQRAGPRRRSPRQLMKDESERTRAA